MTARTAAGADTTAPGDGRVAPLAAGGHGAGGVGRVGGVSRLGGVSRSGGVGGAGGVGATDGGARPNGAARLAGAVAVRRRARVIGGLRRAAAPVARPPG